MGFVTFVGKTLIIASILFQAFLLYQDKKEGDQFNKNLNHAISQCQCLSSIKQHLLQYARLVVIGLLGSSVLILLFKCWSFKLPTLLGLSILLWIEHHGVFCKIPTIELLSNTALWHSLGVIGAILYLTGSDCGSCKNKQKKQPEAEKPTINRRFEDKDNKSKKNK